jgi:hypothetical protein
VAAFGELAVEVVHQQAGDGRLLLPVFGWRH